MNELKTKEKYDLFRKDISLYFRGSNYYSTLFGKMATIVYIALYVLLLVYSSFCGILKKNGTFTSEKTVTKELPNLTLSKDNLYFSYALEDPITYNNIRDDEIYYTEAYYKYGKRVNGNWIWEQQKLEVGPCEVEYFGEKYQDLIKLKPYKTFTCIKKLNQTLYGHFIYDAYSYIHIQVFPCVNDTKHHCKSQEIIDKYLNGTFIDFQMQSVLLNYDYSIPVKNNFEDVYTSVGRGFKRDLHIYFKIMSFEDYGFFGESLGEQKYVQYDSNNPTITINSGLEKNKSICDISIKLSDKTLIVKREYNTLIEIYSKLGGIMELLLKVIGTISFFLVTTLFDISVINELFQFDETNKETLYKGIKKQNIFGVNYNKDKNPNNKSEFEIVKSVYKNKSNFINERKNSILRLNLNPNNKNIKNKRQSILINDFNSKDHILNNAINNNSNIENNINNINKYISENNLNKKANFDKYNMNNSHSMNESKIIKVIKMNPFNLCLFSLFPNKFKSKNSTLLKMGLCTFRAELDVIRLFRIGLLNSRAIEILKKNSILLCFDKEDLVINADIHCMQKNKTDKR